MRGAKHLEKITQIPLFLHHLKKGLVGHIRRAMVEGLNAFHEEALSGQFPTPDYSFNRVVEGYEV